MSYNGLNSEKGFYRGLYRDGYRILDYGSRRILVT